MSKVMGNTQIGRTGLWFIKIRKRFNHEKQQNCREFLEVIRKQKERSLTPKEYNIQSRDSGLSGRVILKEI